jgi:hypothetical protein
MRAEAQTHIARIEAALDELRVGRNCSTDERARTWNAEAYDRGGWARLPQTLSIDTSPAEGFREAFGFDACSVRSYAESTQLPRLNVYRVTDDVADIDAAVRSDPNWSGLLVDDRHAGTDFYNWGDEIDFDLGRTAGRQIPRGGQMAVLAGDAGQVVVRTDDSEAMRSVLDGVASDTERVALRAVVNSLSDRGALAILVSGSPIFWSDSAISSVGTANADAIEALREPPEWALEPWTMMGTGFGFDTDGGFLDVVLMHVRSTDAEANADRIEQMIKSGVSLTDGSDFADFFAFERVEAQDTLLVTRLRPSSRVGPDDGRLMARMIEMTIRRDALFAIG